MSKATAIYIDADACPVKAGIAAIKASHGSRKPQSTRSFN
jgi:uncharacterized protein YaiI (UPF0178 family)